MIDTSQPTSGPSVSAITDRRAFIHNRYAIEPTMVSEARTAMMIESVVAVPICSVL